MYKLFITALLLFMSANLTFANSSHSQISQQYNKTNFQGYVVYVPAGSVCDAVLSTEINSQSAVVGQTITAILTKDFVYENKLIASAGSIVNGTVVLNKQAVFKRKKAQTLIRFTTIRTPYNNLIPINATIQLDENEDEGDKSGQILIPSNSPIKLYFNQPITVGAQ
ncbi:MAG: hypothetical protein IJW73_06010 [Candidatus Gastranaerophilales bacterium]|nr:hypothetical protein [Candidatus Gastranaerophilales bacterium]